MMLQREQKDEVNGKREGSAPPRGLTWLESGKGKPIWVYGATVLAVAGATVLRWWLGWVFEHFPPFITFYPTVALVAMLLGARAGIAATVLSSISADYFFLPPVGTLIPETPFHVVAISFFAASGFLISLLAELLDRTRRRAAAMGAERASATWREAMEAKYRKLHESMMDAFVEVGMDGRVLDFNNAYQTMLGYEREELLKLTYQDLTPKEWHDFEARIVENQIIPTGSSGVYEKEYRRKDGTVFPVELRTSLLRDESGKPTSMWAIVRDITNRKRMEESLLASEERLAAFASATFEGIVYSREGRILDCNEQFAAMLGYTVKELKGMAIADLLAPEGREQVVSNIRANRVSHIEHEMIRKDGTRVIVEAHGRPIIYGQSARRLTVVQDITERKRSEEALRESEERFRGIFDNAGVGMLKANADNRFTAANDRVCQILGYRREELLEMTVRDLTYPDDRAFSDRLNAELQAGVRNRLDYEKRYQRHDGSAFWAHVTITAVRGGRYQGGVATIEDITERKQAEESLKRFSEELERRVAERTEELNAVVKELQRSNEDLEKFAYISSHDLQEPLRMVSSFVGLLASQYRDKIDAEGKEFMDYAIEGAQRMSQLIKDLLAYSQINTQGQEMKVTDAKGVLERAMETLRPRITETGGQVTHGALPRVCADEAQMFQVFFNLVENSLRYRKDGVPLRIDVGAEERDGLWEFYVRDNGIGINAKYHEQIFIPFKRLHSDRSKYPGSGVGLAIVKRIVERHGGRVWVESAEEEGTTIRFTWPGTKENL